MGKERRMNGELRFRLYFSRARARARRCVLQVFLFRFLVFVFLVVVCRWFGFTRRRRGVSPPS